jgi:prefoldin subunit 5
MTRLTRDKGSLQYDDRIDVLAMGVNYWVEQMAADEAIAYNERRVDELEENIKSFMNTADISHEEENVWVKV